MLVVVEVRKVLSLCPSAWIENLLKTTPAEIDDGKDMNDQEDSIAI
jgi:hypothetical protein